MKMRNHKIILGFLLAIFFIQSFVSILFKSPTWDEPTRLAHAARMIREPNWEQPLSLLETALPYYLFGVPHAISRKFFRPRSPFPWRFLGNRVVIYPVDIDFIVARIPMIILGIILGVYIYRWTRELFGVNAGLLALFIYTLSPNILAHTRLITHDISVICFIFIALYYFWRFNKTPTHKNLVLSGITLGVALLSKFSGVLLFPVYAVICIVCIAPGKKHLQTKAIEGKRSVIAVIWIFLIAVFVLWAGYGFMTQRLLDLSDGKLNFAGIRLPAGAYINGIVLHFHHTRVIPRQFFLMGEVSAKTWWYFYIVGLLVKVPIATIIFFCMGLLDFRKKRFLNLVDGSFLAIPVIFIFLYFSFLVPVNRGLRYILPVFPFVFVFIGGAVSQQMKGKWMKVIIIVLGLWYVVSSVRIFPHYLSYFNEFAGGPDNGYKYLVDSDLDWGQDLKGLKRYMEEKKIDKIKLDYFGYLAPKYYRIDHEKLKSIPTSGYVAVSATNLQNVYSDTPDYFFLRTLQPVDKIGYSIFIYYFGEP